MALNRRQLILGSLAASAASIAGCTQGPPTIVRFVNSPQSNTALQVSASALGYSVRSPSLAPGSSKSASFPTPSNLSIKVNVEGTFRLFFNGKVSTVNIPRGQPLAFGKTNTWTVTVRDGKVTKIQFAVS